MNIIISNTSGEPIYQQIMYQIIAHINSGQLREGEMVPSIRQLAKDLRISVITTKRAYEDLEKEGYIISVPGKGSFVAPHNKERIKENQLKLLEEKLVEVIKDSRLLDLSLEELTELLRLSYYESDS